MTELHIERADTTDATDPGPEAPEEPRTEGVRYSVVVPVFNSEALVGQVVERCLAFFDERQLSCEVILVNDGSQDGSWGVISERAAADRRVIAIDLLRNYGQHTALICGFRHSRGDYVLTLDDDLQNPPEEMAHLIAKADEGHDVVFGEFREKKHAAHRRMGSRGVRWINKRVFGMPKDLVVSNFRILRRDVVERICAHRTVWPYVTGLALMYSGSPANVVVEHQARPLGRSQYGPIRIAKLMARILFAYTAFPLRLVTALGALVSVASFLLGSYYLIRSFFVEVQVMGWTTLVVLLSFFNGVTTLMLGMLGEYVVRLLQQSSAASPYEVKGLVGRDPLP